MNMVVDNLSCHTAIVTGATGWLGAAVVNSLVHGISEIEITPNFYFEKVRVLVLPGEDDSNLKKISDKIEIIRGDIRSLKDCQNLVRGFEGSLLFHTAGIIHPRSVREFYEINLQGTINLLEAAKSGKVKRAVVVSSNSPIGCNPIVGHLFDESSSFNPYMHYGQSKMKMELAVMRIQQEGGLETTRLRAPWFYGPHQPIRQTLFFQMIRDGKMPIIGDGTNLRSMAYISNLVQGILLAADQSVANGKVYWIADERPYSMNEIVDTIESVMTFDFGIKCAHKRLRLPNITSDVAWLIDKTIQSCGLYNQKIHVLSEMNKNIACSVQLAKRELGYVPNIDLRLGIKKSIEWALSNNWNNG